MSKKSKQASNVIQETANEEIKIEIDINLRDFVLLCELERQSLTEFSIIYIGNNLK